MGDFPGLKRLGVAGPIPGLRAIPRYSILFHAIPCYSMLLHVIPCYPTLFHTIPRYSTLFHVTPHYSMLFHVIPYYSMLAPGCHFGGGSCFLFGRSSRASGLSPRGRLLEDLTWNNLDPVSNPVFLNDVAPSGHSTLLHTIPSYSMLFHVAPIPCYPTLFHTIQRYSTLFHVTPHYSMLFHIIPC